MLALGLGCAGSPAPGAPTTADGGPRPLDGGVSQPGPTAGAQPDAGVDLESPPTEGTSPVAPTADAGSVSAGAPAMAEATDGGTPALEEPAGGAADDEAGADVAACVADLQALAARGGPGGIVGARGAALGPDCIGTHHQDFGAIERVVFLGDSVTVGTPPANLAADAGGLWDAVGGFFSDIVTDVDETYRSRLSDALAEAFGLDAPSLTWRLWNPLEQGEALQRKSGDFWNCARWGSKTKDLYADGEQVERCFPRDEADRRTLVVFTSGGNDVVDFVQLYTEGRGEDAVWARAEATVVALEEAVAHLKDPALYPAGNVVLFATPFEYTDWSGDIGSCAAAGASGLSGSVEPALMRDLLDWLSVEYLRIAETHGADVVFLLEAFCGHGFQREDASLPCYRGPETERYFDLTCIHPNALGHGQILDRFRAVIDR